MDVYSFFVSHWHFSARRIYWLFLAVGETCLILGTALCQDLNAYKTIASGSFPDISIWEVWNGSVWNPATVKPGQSNDIYIDKSHTLTLIGDETAKSVFIHADTLAAQKLNLDGFNLDIHGTLNAFSGTAPGIPNNAWNSINWIGNSLTSTLTFKGGSRVLIQKNSWSAQTTRSRFAVIFDADAGHSFTMEAPFKALSFTVRSGTLHQKIDTSVMPNVCFTLSFNTETTVYGTGPFGNLTIEPGATFISECNAGILNRSTSGSVSALNFDLQSGGTLILEGNAPRIEAANFQLNGKVIFRGGSATKSYLASSYADATAPISVRDIELQGSHNLTLPSQLTLLGNLEKSGTGNFHASNTSLILAGTGNQEIIGFVPSIRDLTLNKPAGTFLPNSDLTVVRNLTMTQGSMDLDGNNLSINTGLTGSLSYTGGSWKNVGLLTYYGIPSILDGTNATFPFEDTRNGGLRKVQLLGNSPGGNLSISFTEYEGAEYNSGFKDTDNTDILYRLFSYFTFSGLTPSSDPLELRISAHQLIVDDAEDLRIVGTGYAAPGIHLKGLASDLWARRELLFSDLLSGNFTIGSDRTPTILPIFWLGISSEVGASGVLVSWETAGESEGQYFEVYRSSDPLAQEWTLVGRLESLASPDAFIGYQFFDSSVDIFRDNYYRVRQVENSGNSAWSEVTKASKRTLLSDRLLVYPNPYRSGLLRIVLPEGIDVNEAELHLLDIQGKFLHRGKYLDADLTRLIESLSPGMYFLVLRSSSQVLSTRVLRQ